MTQAVLEDEFFVGWSNRLGRGLRLFLGAVAIVFVAGFGLLGFGLGAGVDDPAAGLLRLGERDAAGGPVRPEVWGGEQVLRGHLSTIGYPLLHLRPDAAHPRGRVLLLSGDGKRGADVPQAGGPVELRGRILRRGSIEMLVVDGKARPLGDDDAGIRPAVRERLGRWRIAGEICDGKCYTGAMRPGSGLAHKACANLCLIGEIPPVFVTQAPVAGSFYLALANPDGGPLPARLRDLVAIPITLEGEVERVGNVLVLRVDLAMARRL
jgi:hypothetical protein